VPPSPNWRTGSAISRAPRSSPAATGSPRSKRCAERPPAPAAICLAGAYTGGLLNADGSFTLSPGDLDEAVEVLLVEDWAGRDAAGAADPQQHGYERIGLFRKGVVGGSQACLA
jgi:hypothetical protein